MSDWVSDIKEKDIVGSGSAVKVVCSFKVNGRIFLRYVLNEGRNLDVS